MSIDKNTKQEVKKLAGPSYSVQLYEFLIQEKATNKNGKNYSLSHIRMYFSQETPANNPLDSYFLEFWEKLADEKSKLENRIKRLNKKTKAKIIQ